MSLSYIKARKKSVFTKDVILLIIFFTITTSMLFGTYSYLMFKDHKFEEDKKGIAKQKEKLHIAMSKMESDIKNIEKQNLFCEKIFTKNGILKDSIENLFDLVPAKITLTEAKILEDGLVLYGITPSKDVYNFMLQAPLRSIFHRTYSSFYPAQNGWLNFVSTNYLDEEEEIQHEE